ncbi:hypothetical protein E2C01_097426 [Portunus trituberculatus]|uniref:Uncharacterized protein n=1 Tax=Portunus trituberculatus TaxID=210409 RepID=A0A5B7K9J1_PORTR|nr:hypothetical protein [Portunus trituberculatus]
MYSKARILQRPVWKNSGVGRPPRHGAP